MAQTIDTSDYLRLKNTSDYGRYLKLQKIPQTIENTSNYRRYARL